MKDLISDFHSMVQHYIRKIILFFLVATLIYFAFGISNLISYTKFTQQQIKNNVEEYQEIDMTHLCNVASCKKVIRQDSEDLYSLYEKEDRILKLVNNEHTDSFVELSEDIYVDGEVNFYVYMEGLFIHIDITNSKTNLFIYYFILMAFLMPVFMSILYQSVKEEKKASMTTLMTNEALLANKSMILITENIHHELNSPMEIIENKVYKLKDIIMPLLNPAEVHDCDLLGAEDKVELYEDFNMISQSAEQVYAVLERMQGFKHIRYSNGNKSIKDSLMAAFRVISISNSNFDFNVDQVLYDYRLKGKTVKNGDLLNITLNHIKNSLEANATKIYIIIEDFDGKHIYFRIIDNGNGIADETQKKIFEPNFSTKDEPGNIRGNGLYLNKSILNASGGDVKMVESSKYGTTFELKMLAEKRPDKHIQKEDEE